MTKEKKLEQWFEEFDQNKDQFKWFFDDYFPTKVWDMLMSAREIKDQEAMHNIMNRVWFELPDSRFNIMENPTGWSIFLALIEE